MVEVDDVLADILRLRGAAYACLADRSSGRIISEAGHDDFVTFPGVVVRLDKMVADALGQGLGDELEDLMISFRNRYHLVRHIDLIGAPPLLLYLRMQRSRANLAAARRELASAELISRLTEALQNHRSIDRDKGKAASRGNPDHLHGTRSGSPGPGGSSPTSATGPATGPATAHRPASVPRAIPAPRQTTTPRQTSAQRPTSAPQPTSIQRPAPTPRSASTPPPASAQQPGAARPHQPDAAHQLGPMPSSAGPPDAVVLPLPRRAPAAARAGWADRERERERESEPNEPTEVPAVLRQSWAFDRGTMERLVIGLRRMMR